jgi:putative nucleotidyltransferase with HDIG domain
MRLLDSSPAFLRTRVARRILLLFVMSALVPTLALTFVSYRHVSGQLLDEAGVRLQQAGKTAGMDILQHLQGVRAELDRSAAALAAGEQGIGTFRPFDHGMRGIGRSTGPRFELLGGEMRPPPPLPEAQARHVAAGRVALLVDTLTAEPRMLLVRRVDSSSEAAGRLWAEVSPKFLWGSDGAGGLMADNQDLCVFDSGLRPLLCTRPMPADAVREAAAGRSGTFSWSGPAGDFISGHFTMFLGFDYGAPSWSVVPTEARANVLRPLAEFRRSFFGVVLLALGIVFILSQVQIRRVLTPLDELSRATKRLAAQDFSLPAQVATRDEFGQLANSFNVMAAQLQSQFAALRAMQEFDRAALAAGDREGVAAAVAAAVQGTTGCDRVTLALADQHEAANWRVAALEGGAPAWRTVTLALAARARLELATAPLTVHDRDPEFGVFFARQGGAEAVLFSLRHEGRVSAVLILQPEVSAAGLASTALPLADQVSLALSRVHLVEDLEALNRETLTALARAIDANSRWTAGHSERVSVVARAIGLSLQLPHSDLELLTRGALLHDIGKIGVSAALLDKPGPLTPDEVEAMRAHTTLGATILAPVRAYRNLIALVRSHHEVLDGSGYPDGLAGDQIPPLVRILTVADIFDALVSERPYRAAWPVVQAVALLKDGAGVKFDRTAVGGFLRALGAGDPALWQAYPALAEQLTARPQAADEQLLTGAWR